MNFVTCTHDAHAGAILEIFNDAILTSTALYEYRPRTADVMTTWFDAKERGGYPVIGVVDGEQFLGFASYGPFRAWPAYKYSVEHSIYVHPQHRRRGVGRMLLEAVIERAIAQEYHMLVAGIDGENAVSIALHQRFGFVHCGTVRHAGFKFGRWLDLAFYQRILETPAHPVDG